MNRNDSSDSKPFYDPVKKFYDTKTPRFVKTFFKESARIGIMLTFGDESLSRPKNHLDVAIGVRSDAGFRARGIVQLAALPDIGFSRAKGFHVRSADARRQAPKREGGLFEGLVA